MHETIKCPKCNKRIFDLEWQGRTSVKIKCIHCRNIVSIERNAVATQKRPVYTIPSNGTECE